VADKLNRGTEQIHDWRVRMLARMGSPPRKRTEGDRTDHGDRLRSEQLYQRYQGDMEDQIGALGLVLNALVPVRHPVHGRRSETAARGRVQRP
jgi:hypothetical protein